MAEDRPVARAERGRLQQRGRLARAAGAARRAQVHRAGPAARTRDRGDRAGREAGARRCRRRAPPDDGEPTTRPRCVSSTGVPPGSLRYFAVLFAGARGAAAARGALRVRGGARAGSCDGASHEAAHARLQWWRGEARSARRGPARATRCAGRCCRCASAATATSTLLHELLAAADLDLARLTYRTWQELEAYCFRSAGALQTLHRGDAGRRPRADTPPSANSRGRLGSAVRQVGDAARPATSTSRAGRLYAPLERARGGRHRPAGPELGHRGTGCGQRLSWPTGAARCARELDAAARRCWPTRRAALRAAARPRARRPARTPARALTRRHHRAWQTRAACSPVDRVAHGAAPRLNHRRTRTETPTLPTDPDVRILRAPRPGCSRDRVDPRHRRQRRARRRAGHGLRRARRRVVLCGRNVKKLEARLRRDRRRRRPRPSIAPLDLERADASHYAALADARAQRVRPARRPRARRGRCSASARRSSTTTWSPGSRSCT